MSWSLSLAAALLGFVAPAPPAPPAPPVPPAPPTDASQPDERPIEIEVGAHLALRPEARRVDELTRESSGDSWRVRQAARAFVHGFAGPASVKVSGQHVYDWGAPPTISGSGRPPNPTNRTGLFEGYFDVNGERGKASGFVRVGRQWFHLGSQRLLAARYWQPGNISIDALRTEGSLGIVTLGAFGSILGAPHNFTVPDPSDPAADETVRSRGHLFGASYLFIRAHEAATIEAYAFGWNEGTNQAAPTRNRRYQTYTLRLHGEPVSGLRYSLEGFRQGGRKDGRDHLAWSTVASIAYQTRDLPARPALSLGYELHTGERCVNEADDPAGCGAETSRDFDRLLGIGHRDRGHMDLVGPSNNRTLSLKSSLRPLDSLTLNLDYHFFQLHEPEGKWLLNNGRTVGRGWELGNTDRNLGHEIDLNLLYQPWKTVSIRPAYGIFVPATAGRRIAGPDLQHFAYVWLRVDIGRRW